MGILIRMLKSWFVFGTILTSYLFQYALEKLFEQWDKDPQGREEQSLPGWLIRRRARLHAVNSKRLLNGMLRLRGVFIKLGQVLSIMGGFLPRVYTKELEQLQDQVPPQPLEAIEGAIFESTGRTTSELFARFDSTPLAAASLGQVHVAELFDGTKVAVKVLYPGIRSIIAVDMQVVELALTVYRFFVPVSGLERVHGALLDLLRRETDYIHEAQCMERMAANFAKERDILFPLVLWDRTTSDVLTMTFMDGIKINKLDEVRAAGIDANALAIRFTETFYKQLFVDKFFHADPHPGNFLVQPGRTPRRPKLVILDFGAISEVNPALIDGLLDVIGGIVEGKEERLLDGFLAMGFVSKEANRELLLRTVRKYFERLLRIKDRTPAALMRANQKELEQLVDPEMARDELRELMRSVEYPEGWFYVERASVMAFWLLSQIDPELDAMQVGYPYVMPLLKDKINIPDAADVEGAGVDVAESPAILLAQA